VHYLADKYREKPVAVGLGDDGNLFELLISRDGRSWTFIRTLPDGTACLVAAGENWQSVPTAVGLEFDWTH
jgi:hypothetical protein